MSDLLVAISSIAGESQIVGYQDQIECVASSHAVDLPIVPGNAARVEGASRHGAIELEHMVDIASPGLRLAVSSGQNLGEVVITRFRMLAGESRSVEEIRLGDAYVVRVDLDTPLSADTSRPTDEPTETFALEYSTINWEVKKFVGAAELGFVACGFDLGQSRIL